MVFLQRTQGSRGTLTSTNYIIELLIKLAKTQPSNSIGDHQLSKESMHLQEVLRDILQQDLGVYETKRECQLAIIGGKGANNNLPKERQSILFGGGDDCLF